MFVYIFFCQLHDHDRFIFLKVKKNLKGPDQMSANSTFHCALAVQKKDFLPYSKGRLPNVGEGSGLRYCEKKLLHFSTHRPTATSYLANNGLTSFLKAHKLVSTSLAKHAKVSKVWIL